MDRDTLENYVQEILDQCLLRRIEGAKVYGETLSEDRDMIDELIEEVYDSINYAMFEIIRMKELKKKRDALKL